MKNDNRFKIKKPYDKHIKKLINNPYVDIDHQTTGLYFLRAFKHNHYIGVMIMGHNKFRIYKKNEYRKRLEGCNYSWFE